MVNDLNGRALATEYFTAPVTAATYPNGVVSNLQPGQKVTHRLIVNGEVMG